MLEGYTCINLKNKEKHDWRYWNVKIKIFKHYKREMNSEEMSMKIHWVKLTFTLRKPF